MPAVDATAVYYTFSTIAQTLAALVGVLMAFAVMRLSDLGSRLASELPSFAKHCQYAEAFFGCLARGDFEKAITCVHDGGLESTEELVFDACRRSSTEHKRLLAALRRSLIVTGSVIAYSIACLPLATEIVSCQPLAFVLLALGVAGVVVSLAVVAGLAGISWPLRPSG